MASIALTLVFGVILHARSMEAISAVGMIAGIMVGGFYGGLSGMKLAVRFQTGAR